MMEYIRKKMSVKCYTFWVGGKWRIYEYIHSGKSENCVTLARVLKYDKNGDYELSIASIIGQLCQ